MNTIEVIYPYRFGSSWVFDDERVNLSREPFVCGIDKIIDAAVKDIPNAASGFKLLFSANPFPNYSLKLDWEREEFSGNWYRCEALGMSGWICPAMFRYMDTAPKELFARVEAKN
jgi:hypothetical protein